MIFSDKMQEIATKMGFTFKDYLQTLEEEHKKVLMFQRELPLCLELVTQAIDYCKKELSMTTEEYFHGDELECSEQTSSEEIVPILEEFIPLKKNSSSILEEKKSHQNNMEKENLCQSDWLRSAQLWNQISSDPIPTHNQDLHEKTSVEETCFVEVKRNGGAFQPFQREKTVNKIDNNHEHDQSPAGGGGTSSSSTAETASAGSGGSSKREEKEKENHRKQRRCWSPELHRRFLHALQQLGGSHVATPKQIRESMKVDGLTNDEVKSHLQKYRLHTRRPSPTIHNNDGAQQPQFLVVGGIWVPAPEYASMATTVVATSPPPVTQAPASIIHRPKPKVSGQSNSGSGDGVGVAGAVHCNSPATSSSTPISTISHVS